MAEYFLPGTIIKGSHNLWAGRLGRKYRLGAQCEVLDMTQNLGDLLALKAGWQPEYGVIFAMGGSIVHVKM